jgi:hypothetical protein
MSPDVLKKMEAFKNSTDAPKFACILGKGGTRKQFADDLTDRCNKPELIAQGRSSLCGPAAFMYCVAREKPDEYAHCVLDLAMTGKGNLGGLQVEPTPGGRNELTEEKIAPVDWVALGSVRKMNRVDSGLEGMTFGNALMRWFNATGWFYAVNETSPASSKSQAMNDLFSINKLDTCYVCLLITSKIIERGQPGWGGADHWVVLGDGKPNGGGTNGASGHQIWVQDACPDIKDIRTCIAQNRNVELPRYVAGGDRDLYSESIGNRSRYGGDKEKYENKLLSFKVYSWGEIKAIKDEAAVLKEFLKNYYGYVRAKRNGT